MADEFKGIGNETLRNVEALKSSMKEIAEATNKTNKSLREQTLLSADYASSFSKISSSANKFAELQDKAKRSASATSEAFKEQQKQLSVVRSLNAQIDNLYDQMLDANEKQEKVLKKQVNNLSAARDNAQELAKEFGDLVNDSSKLDKSTMWFSALSQVVTDIPGLRKLSSPFEAAAKASRETALNNAKNKAFLDEALETGKGLTKEKIKELGLEKEAGGLTGKAAAAKLKAAGVVAKTESVGIAGLQAGFKALGPIIKGVFAPLAIITTVISAVKALIDLMFEADKRITSIAKNMSLTKEEATSVYKSLTLSKGEINTIYNDTENLVTAFTDLAQITDFVSSATNKQLETQIILTKQLGLSKEEALGYQEALINSTENQEKGLDIVYDQIAAFANQNKITANASAIFKEIGKTSKTIQLNFKGNLTELTKTVLEAKKLGLTLDQVDNVANSLLNFEESISSELEAELLLGQDINLEKARTAALNNDIATLTEEIAKQGITAEKFSRLNRIQQEALAKTLGMNSKELGESLYQQQLIQRTGGEELKQLRERAKLLRANGKEEEAQNLERKAALIEQGLLRGEDIKKAQESASAQEKFEQAVKRLKEVFTDLVTGGTLDKIANFIEKIAKRLESGQSLTGAILGTQSDIKTQAILTTKAREQVKTATTPEEKTKAEANLKTQEDQLLIEQFKRVKESYESNPFSALFGKFEESPGYEKQKAKFEARGLEFPPKLKEGGIVPEGYSNDTFPARLSSGEAVVPLTEFYAKLDQLTMAVKQGGNVYLDLQKVGTTTDQGTYRLNS